LGKYLLIMLGGASGSLARYLTGTAIMERVGGRYPIGTLVVNVSGSFLVGLIMTLLVERWALHPYWRLLLVVGFLGGYTTFSAFEYETFQAIRSGGWWLGLLNVLSSVILGYLAVWCGSMLARFQP
jgi:CrcB protein